MYGSKFGQGKYNFSDGRKYQGNYYNGLADGQGVFYLKNTKKEQ